MRMAGRFSRMEAPKSPRTAEATNSTYCTASGRSRPSGARVCAISSWVALWSTRKRVGSPVRRTRKKTTVTTPQVTNTACSRRRRRKAGMGGRTRLAGGGGEDSQIVAADDFGGVGGSEAAAQHRGDEAREMVVLGKESRRRGRVGADAEMEIGRASCRERV